MSGVRSPHQFWRPFAAGIPAGYSIGLSGLPYIGEFGRAARFLATGAFATLLNLCLLWVLTVPLGFSLLTAGVLAFRISAACNFTCQKFCTFVALSVTDLRGEAARFVAVNLANLFLNSVILYVLTQRLGLGYLVAQMVSSALIAVESYYAYRAIFSWRSNEHSTEASEGRRFIGSSLGLNTTVMHIVDETGAVQLDQGPLVEP